MHYDKKSQPPLQQVLQAFGQRLEAYRISRQLKQSELAELAGVSRVTISRLESGESGTLDTLLRVLRALDIEARFYDLLPDARQSPLDPLTARGDKRQRVRDSTSPESDEAWQWDDDAP